jgi:uncharacterized protein YjiS (DUF1127 family)
LHFCREVGAVAEKTQVETARRATIWRTCRNNRPQRRRRSRTQLSKMEKKEVKIDV